jgi:hypothetical protein
MAERKATKGKQSATKRATGEAAKGFTDEEKAALREQRIAALVKQAAS